jgi:uncharacterized membrane protein YeaQ/YmgE (transglycosylase-associated protein family)
MSLDDFASDCEAELRSTFDWITPQSDAPQMEYEMSFLAWIVLGLIAGFIGNKLVGDEGGSILGDIVLGVVGAFVGGLLFNFFGASGVTGVNLWSILVATLGSVATLVIYHAIRRRRRN